MEEKEYPSPMANFLNDIKKGQVTQQKINDLKNYMNGKKFPQELREDAESLLARGEEVKIKSPAPAHTAGNYQGNRGSYQGNRNSGGFQDRGSYQGNRGSYQGNRGSYQGNRNNGNGISDGRNAGAARPDIIGYPFHNPYTFIPFPDSPPERHAPTPLSIDEVEKDRVSGVIQVKIKTLSPLLTSEASPLKDKPQRRPILTIGNDVIVPATSVRGSLRNLMSIICGGTLSYVDEELWLCQGRDTPLGGINDNLYLARIEKPGDSSHNGIVTWGKAKLVSYAKLFHLLKKKGWIKPDDDIEDQPLARLRSQLWIDNPADPQDCSDKKNERCTWLVKRSGPKVDRTIKDLWHEGAFQPSETMEIDASLWGDYKGRNRNGFKPDRQSATELRKGDIIWLQSTDKDNKIIRGKDDVESIQWARWGKTGKKLADVVPDGFLPDAMNMDGKVDMVSDLFGQVFLEKKGSKRDDSNAVERRPFAARVVPENLVFKDAAAKEHLKEHLIEKNMMPPLSSPHPGCIAFYLNNDDYDAISINDPPRGYKVYRTSTKTEEDRDAPWHYDTQPIYKRGIAQNFNTEENKMLFSADLLRAGQCGSLKISFRALSRAELSTLILALTCDLRFGGGKPLGLGHCIAEEIVIIREDGSREVFLPAPERPSLPDGYSVDERILKQANLYCQTQKPIDDMKYPRSFREFVIGKNNKDDRSGMIWFKQFASAKESEKSTGLKTTWTEGELQEKVGGKDQIRAQALPKFDPDPTQDRLYGYDAQLVMVTHPRDKRRFAVDVKGPSQVHSNPNAKRYRNDSPNKDSRQKGRDSR